MDTPVSEVSRRFTLSVLPETLAVARLDAAAAVPTWAMDGRFFSITRTADELSIVCEARRVPKDVRAERVFRGLQVHGPFALSEIGVMATLSTALAQARVSVFAIATFDTDYLLVSGEQLQAAIGALRRAGHRVEDCSQADEARR